jgi:hypothetical protein
LNAPRISQFARLFTPYIPPWAAPRALHAGEYQSLDSLSHPARGRRYDHSHPIQVSCLSQEIQFCPDTSSRPELLASRHLQRTAISRIYDEACRPFLILLDSVQCSNKEVNIWTIKRLRSPVCNDNSRAAFTIISTDSEATFKGQRMYACIPERSEVMADVDPSSTNHYMPVTPGIPVGA